MQQYADSLGSRVSIDVGGRSIEFFHLDAVKRAGFGDPNDLPYTIRILLENLLRHEDGTTVTIDHILAVAGWDPGIATGGEIAYRPARVLLQDLTGVPAVVDLAAMREAFFAMGGDPARINPLQPADMVIDHSVQVDSYGSSGAFDENVRREFERNGERYQFLKWGQWAFNGLRVIPPDMGIVHQINLEQIAPVVFLEERDGRTVACPDTLVGTDSHTTMINGLGVLGWGVGGIEAEAAMLGQPISMLPPRVIGFGLNGRLRDGVTATDLVLTVVQLLRERGVVGKFVEFVGDGLDHLSLPDRATLANMAPETGATVCFFPVDEEALSYLRFTGRDAAQVDLVERYCKEQGLFRLPGESPARYSDWLELDLDSVVPSLAGPRRPQDRIDLRESKRAWRDALRIVLRESSDRIDTAPDSALVEPTNVSPEPLGLMHGSVVIAAITSCTNTSNPAALMAAGLLARNAVERGLSVGPNVKTSLAPGSRVATDYLIRAGLMEPLEKLGFHLVAYGCTTCIGNSGPLSEPISSSIVRNDLVAVSVLSGNRNFEGRIHPHVRANYLASPSLVVAYAIAGTMDIDFERDPIGTDADDLPVFLRDIRPSDEEIAGAIRSFITCEMFKESRKHLLDGTDAWRSIRVPKGKMFEWDPESTYIRKPPFFDTVSAGDIDSPRDIAGARVLALLGDSITTDHISPAGAISPESPAAEYLSNRGVPLGEFNTYGSRRGNHEVMVRGTFANIRLRNLLASGTEGGVTRHLPAGDEMAIYDAAMLYRSEGVPLVILAGREYGTGSSRDWAAKGTLLLGVRAVIAVSFERIHRSNLIGMGVLPLEFLPGESHRSLGLTGEEIFSITGIEEGLTPGCRLRVDADGRRFQVVVRLETLHEVEYYMNGGMLRYVLRRLAAHDGDNA